MDPARSTTLELGSLPATCSLLDDLCKEYPARIPPTHEYYNYIIEKHFMQVYRQKDCAI